MTNPLHYQRSTQAINAKKTYSLGIIFLLCQLYLSPLFAKNTVVYKEKSEKHQFYLEEMAILPRIVWGFDWLKRNKIIFTIRDGKIGILNLKTKKYRFIKNIPTIYASGQGGMLDVRVHPDYPRKPWIYLSYSKKQGQKASTVLARTKLKNSTFTKFQELLVADAFTNTDRHFGSRVVFDNKGYLYWSIGDRGHRPNGQNLKTHAGSILRLHTDGRVPSDNPFVPNKQAKAEIWSYGHRNPQGLHYDLENQRLWAVEHGPRGGDEINLIFPGKNYGWPTISYGKEYWGSQQVGEGTKKKGMVQPKKYYTPSIAPSGMLLYQGKKFPKWQGNLLIGALALRHLNRLVVKNAEIVHEERLLEDFAERIRDVRQGPEGYPWISTDTGKILRIRPW